MVTLGAQSMALKSDCWLGQTLQRAVPWDHQGACEAWGGIRKKLQAENCRCRGSALKALGESWELLVHPGWLGGGGVGRGRVGQDELVRSFRAMLGLLKSVGSPWGVKQLCAYLLGPSICPSSGAIRRIALPILCVTLQEARLMHAVLLCECEASPFTLWYKIVGISRHSAIVEGSDRQPRAPAQLTDKVNLLHETRPLRLGEVAVLSGAQKWRDSQVEWKNRTMFQTKHSIKISGTFHLDKAMPFPAPDITRCLVIRVLIMLRPSYWFTYFSTKPFH